MKVEEQEGIRWLKWWFLTCKWDGFANDTCDPSASLDQCINYNILQQKMMFLYLVN